VGRVKDLEDSKKVTKDTKGVAPTGLQKNWQD